MPGCTPSASTSAPAVTASSTSPAVLTGHSCLHTSCLAHLGISEKRCDCAQLACLCCLHVQVNTVPSTAPLKCAPSGCELCQKRVIDCGPQQQPKEIMAENRLCLKMVVGCPAAQRESMCCPITDSPLQHSAGLFLGACVVCVHT